MTNSLIVSSGCVSSAPVFSSLASPVTLLSSMLHVARVRQAGLGMSCRTHWRPSGAETTVIPSEAAPVVGESTNQSPTDLTHARVANDGMLVTESVERRTVPVEIPSAVRWVAESAKPAGVPRAGRS